MANNSRTYQSRGHGGRHNPKSAHGAVNSRLRRAGSSKYQPHQGAQEIARRAARGLDRQCGVLHG